MSELTSKHVKNRMIYSSHEDDYLFNQKLLQSKTKIDFLFLFHPLICVQEGVLAIFLYMKYFTLIEYFKHL